MALPCAIIKFYRYGAVVLRVNGFQITPHSGGWIYNRVAKKGVLVGGKSGSTPMKDTEQLYNDFDWEISEK